MLFRSDGDEFFTTTVATTEFLSRNGLCPEMMIVGILSTDRMHDLTPWHDAVVPKDSDLVRTSGGGEQFTSFITKELIPYIGSHYPAASYRMLAGHSLGGLLVLNTLVNHPEMFNSYLAMDPAIYWAGQRLLQDAAIKLKNRGMDNKRLYMGLSRSRRLYDSVQGDKTLATIFERSVLLFDSMASESSDVQHYRAKYYNDETHNTVVMPAMYDGLRFIFDFFQMPGLRRDSVTTDFYAGRYKMISKQMGYAVLPPEDLINNMGYYFLQQGKYDKARSFFQMNIDNYPKSFNVYDSMSDLYTAENDKPKAIEYLEKELKLEDHPYIRKKLEDLRK